MATEEQQYAAAVVTKAQGEVGYQPGRTWSRYGQWYGSPNALWCACGATCTIHEALGAAAGRAVSGVQEYAPNGRGFAWTVAWRKWLAEHGTKIPLANVRGGDILFFKYPTGDHRNTAVVNHVDLIVGPATATTIPTVGFNTPEPGKPGDPSNGRGVWRHNRALNDKYIVDAYRPPWWRHPDLITFVQSGLAELDHDPGPMDGLWGTKTEQAVHGFQVARGLVPDKIPGPATRAGIALALIEHAVEEGALTMSDVATITTAIDRLRADLPAATAAAVWHRLLPRAGSDEPTTYAQTFLRYAASRSDLARVEAGLAEANGHDVDVAELAQLLLPVLTEAIADAASDANAEGIIDALAARLAPQED